MDKDTDEAKSLRKPYRFMIKLRNHFWYRWRREYLTNLREIHKGKGKVKGSIAKVGDVVLVYDEGLKRGFWKLVVMERLVKGKDGVVRGATVRMVEKGRSRALNRPLQKLHPLEISEECLNEVETRKNKACKGESSQVGEEARPRVFRRAAALNSLSRKPQQCLNHKCSRRGVCGILHSFELSNKIVVTMLVSL
ncbi:uncharacterized protein LOC124451225 [Xenia sp. Carnegie-2017]|uniref:uncharacterized protein LOC124451225 n=1 Tax=Xenia sp. Carnegie-2017 TaxID=2897299 RepID=UPI001F0468CE|nr:uncharacterized protein LOC124451225 [Xenia sp. Carnegie-2017]